MEEHQHKYRCIVVDDDELDRIMVKAYISKYPFLEMVGVYPDAESAILEIDKTRPQILFLDIDMGEMSGLDLRKELMDIDVCIFITSYPEYAVESFEVDALDFIVKPISSERFEKSTQRLQEYLELKHKSDLFDFSLDGDAFFIKEGHEHIKIKTHDIVYLEALKDYTKIITADKKYCVLSSLGNLLMEASFSSFIRIHKSYAIQRHFLRKISSSQIEIGEFKLPIGRKYKNDVINLLQ